MTSFEKHSDSWIPIGDDELISACGEVRARVVVERITFSQSMSESHQLLQEECDIKRQFRNAPRTEKHLRDAIQLMKDMMVNGKPSTAHAYRAERFARAFIDKVEPLIEKQS